MRGQSLKKQTLVTAGSAMGVRAVGFFLRLWVSRALGAEAVGIMELSSNVHMLALTPLAAGLPGAVSRLCARAAEKEGARIFYAARQIAVRSALLLTALFLLLCPLIAQLLGDERTLPSLYAFSPCMLLIGVSCVYNGYCHGKGNAWPPAWGETGEQLARALFTLFFLSFAARLALPYRAALPALSTVLGEGAGLLIVCRLCGKSPSFRGDERLPAIKKRILRLSLPLMLSRLSHTFLRTLCSTLIPLRLMAAGLPKGEALGRMGMLNGMVNPLLFLPGMLTGALATVGGPAAARCKSRKKENRLIFRLLSMALGTGMLSAGGLYFFAPLLAKSLYRLPEVSPLLRAMCPLSVLLPVQQVASGLMTGLGLQKKALIASLLGAGVTLLCTYLWTADPLLHIYGAGYGNLAGHGLSLFCSLVFLFCREKEDTL